MVVGAVASAGLFRDREPLAEDQRKVAADQTRHLLVGHGVVGDEVDEAGVLEFEQGLTDRRAVTHPAQRPAALEGIEQAAEQAGHSATHHWPTKEAAGEAVAADLQAGDVVLLKASRAMEFETLVELLKE